MKEKGTNFLKEIERELFKNGYTFRDIKYINVGEPNKYADYIEETCEPCTHIVKWLEKQDFYYDQSYGCVHINMELKIVLEDGAWLERHEYDGAEWFEFKKTPEREGRDK